jgi:hypothetical protein
MQLGRIWVRPAGADGGPVAHGPPRSDHDLAVVHGGVAVDDQAVGARHERGPQDRHPGTAGDVAAVLEPAPARRRPSSPRATSTATACGRSSSFTVSSTAWAAVHGHLGGERIELDRHAHRPDATARPVCHRLAALTL